MNETLETIMNRRSCRKFTSEELPFDKLMEIVTAGRFAATAMGAQPWWFNVVRDKNVIHEIELAVQENLANSEDEHLRELANIPTFSLFYGAPTLIVVCGNASPYAVYDCANACQNMCVAAASYGFGSCYNTGFLQAFENEDKAAVLLQALEIPEGYIPLAAVALGYKAPDCPDSPAGGVRMDNVTIVRPSDEKAQLFVHVKDATAKEDAEADASAK